MKIGVCSKNELKQPEIKVRLVVMTALGTALVLGGLTLGQKASAISVEDQVTISPVYQQYMADVAAGNGVKWKLVPNKFVSNTIIGGKGSGEALPAAYNLVDAGFGTTLKNQGLDGDCWAFATTTAIESNLKKTQGINVEFSPKQMDYLFASGTPYYAYLNENMELTRNLGDGGNFLLASFGLSGQYTPVTETSFFAKMQANDASLNNYTSWKGFEDISMINHYLFGTGEAYTKPMDKSLVMGETSDYVVTNYRSYDGDTDLIGEIKNDIYNYGAAYVGTIAPEVTGCWDESTKTIVDRGMICGSENGHAMAIVGWDDNHTYTDPSDGSVKTGAFLLQNSWGSSTLFNDHGYDYNAIVRTLISMGKIESEADLTNDQKEALHHLVEEMNNYEYVWMGYDFDDSLVTGSTNFASIQEVRANNYKKIYDPINQAEGLGTDGNTDLVYTFTTGEETESASAVSVATHGMTARYDVKYTVYVNVAGDSSDWKELGSVVMPAGETGQTIMDLDGSVELLGTFKIKLVGMVGDEPLEISSEYAPYFTASVYTVDSEDLPVPNTAAAQNMAVPNTGLFTGNNDWAGFGGVMIGLVMLTTGVIGYIVVRNRKHLFHKISFSKKN